MDIKDLYPLEWLGQRVLTNAQIAKLYGTTPARIRDNFKREKKYFVEGVHYFKLNHDQVF